MSLNSEQRERTARELAQNAALSGLSREELIERSGLEPTRFDAALRVESAEPADVWLLRDVLARAAEEAGEQAVSYSVLTEEMRSAAGRWFGVPGRR